MDWMDTNLPTRGYSSRYAMDNSKQLLPQHSPPLLLLLLLLHCC